MQSWPPQTCWFRPRNDRRKASKCHKTCKRERAIVTTMANREESTDWGRGSTRPSYLHQISVCITKERPKPVETTPSCRRDLVCVSPDKGSKTQESCPKVAPQNAGQEPVSYSVSATATNLQKPAKSRTSQTRVSSSSWDRLFRLGGRSRPIETGKHKPVWSFSLISTFWRPFRWFSLLAVVVFVSKSEFTWDESRPPPLFRRYIDLSIKPYQGL